MRTFKFSIARSAFERSFCVFLLGVNLLVASWSDGRVKFLCLLCAILSSNILFLLVLFIFSYYQFIIL